MRVRSLRNAALATAGLAAMLAAGPAAAQSRAQVKAVTAPQIAAIEAKKAKRTAPEEKVSSQLLDIASQSKSGVVNAAAPHLKVDGAVAPQQLVKVDIRTTTPTPSAELQAAIADLHGADIKASTHNPVLTASVPASALKAIAARADVKKLVKHEEPTKHQAPGDDPPWAREGRLAHAADRQSVQDFKVKGAGSVVCVISDSLDNAAGDKGRAFTMGALDPAKVHVLEGEDGAGTASQTGEGLAMLEIIHAIAPEAELWFATGNGGPAHMADNILTLRDTAHCDIIVDDLTYPSESPFQDDDIAMAVDQVSQQGVLYFSSARNSGNKKHGTSGTWEGMFHDGGPAGAKYGLGAKARIHVFEDGKTLNTADKAGPDDRVDLFWSDPLGGSRNGYDLFVVNPYGHVIRSSTTSHTGSQDPYQSVDHLHSGESIVIVKEAGAQPRFLHLDTGRAVLRHSTTGSVRGHNASGAENAFTVAARGVSNPAVVFAGDPNASVETFSSDGPRRVFFKPTGAPYTPGNFSDTGGEVRQKPDITAADGVSTTLPSGSALNPFFGTSAAAPHAAAIAALMLSCNPKPTAAKVRNAFKSSAIAIEGASGNINAGYGIVMAKSALKAACPLATLAPTPAAAGPAPADGRE